MKISVKFNDDKNQAFVKDIKVEGGRESRDEASTFRYLGMEIGALERMKEKFGNKVSERQFHLLLEKYEKKRNLCRKIKLNLSEYILVPTDLYGYENNSRYENKKKDWSFGNKELMKISRVKRTNIK